MKLLRFFLLLFPLAAGAQSPRSVEITRDTSQRSTMATRVVLSAPGDGTTIIKDYQGKSLVSSTVRFETVSRMMATTGLRAGVSYTVDEGERGGQFQIDPSDLSTPTDWGMVFVTADGKRLKRRLDGNTIHFKWYAPVLDGSSQAAKLRAAITMAASLRAKTIDLNGYSVPTNQLVLQSGMTLQNGSLISLGAAGTNNALIYAANRSDITLENLRIEASPVLDTLGTERAINLVSCSNVRIKDVTIRNFSEQPIRLTSVTKFKITDCTLQNNNRKSMLTGDSADDDYGSIALYFCTRGELSGLEMDENGTGISVAECEDIDIHHSHIYGNGKNVSAMGIWVIWNSKNIKVHYNTFKNFYNEAVVFTNIGSTDKLGQYVMADHNYVEDTEYAGISIDTRFTDAILSDNIIVSQKKSIAHGLNIKETENVLANNNRIHSVVDSPDGILVEDSKAVRADGNILTGDLQAAITNRRSSRSSFSSNIIPLVGVNDVGIRVHPSNSAVNNTYNSNIVRGNGLGTNYLYFWTSDGNVDLSTLVGNVFQTGNFGLNNSQRSVISSNVLEGTTNAYGNNNSNVMTGNYRLNPVVTLTANAALQPNVDYVVNSTGTATLQAPTAFVSGDQIRISGQAGTWRFATPSNHLVKSGTSTTTAGGYLEGGANTSVTLKRTYTGTWQIVSSSGPLSFQ